MIALMIVFVGIAMRFLPHPANVAPVAAIALFAGTYLNKKYALWVPLAIMVISDMFIGIHDVVLYTWGSFLIVGLIGIWLKNHKTLLGVGAASIISSFLFFFVTNFGVWLTWYPRNLAGLVNCYTLAIPFYRNTMIGDLAYVVIFFGIYELVARSIRETKFAYLTS